MITNVPELTERFFLELDFLNPQRRYLSFEAYETILQWLHHGRYGWIGILKGEVDDSSS